MTDRYDWKKELANNDWLIRCEFLATGSRIICNPPVLDTDEDWVVFVYDLDDYQNVLNELQDKYGFEVTSPESYGLEHYEFTCLRRDDLNLIVSADIKFYRCWIIATDLAMRLNIRDKDLRVEFFKAVFGEHLQDD